MVGDVHLAMHRRETAFPPGPLLKRCYRDGDGTSFVELGLAPVPLLPGMSHDSLSLYYPSLSLLRRIHPASADSLSLSLDSFLPFTRYAF